MTCSLKNRQPFKPHMLVQDGWYSTDNFTRHPRMVAVPFRMAGPCQFQKDDKYNLPDCVGCSWKQPQEAA